MALVHFCRDITGNILVCSKYVRNVFSNSKKNWIIKTFQKVHIRTLKRCMIIVFGMRKRIAVYVLTTRQERKRSDKLTAIHEIWYKWVQNVLKLINPNENITLDEQLVALKKVFLQTIHFQQASKI